jgi:hypothetical protein
MRTIFMKGSYWQKEHCLRGLMTSDLETAADKYAIKTYNMYIKDETTLNNKEGDEILSDAFKAGANWGRNQAKVEIQAQSMALAHECPKELESEDLEEAVEECISSLIPEQELDAATPFSLEFVVALLHKAFRAGAKWQKEQMMKNIWKPADGDDLPPIDKEVIVLTQPYPLGGNEYVVSFAHRPNPDGWDEKSVITGKTVHYMPKTYGEGGWNIPNIIYWLDVELPKEIEL